MEDNFDTFRYLDILYLNIYMKEEKIFDRCECFLADRSDEAALARLVPGERLTADFVTTSKLTI